MLPNTLFFILICYLLCLVHTSRLKFKGNRNLCFLQDSEDTPKAVEPKCNDVQVSAPSQEQPTTLQTTDPVLNNLKDLMDQERYEEVSKFNHPIKKCDFLKYILPIVTSIDHYQGLYGYLKLYKLFLIFILYGNLKLVKEAITKFNNFNGGYNIHENHLQGAIISSLKQNQHDRIIGLLEAVHARPEGVGQQDEQNMTNFGSFMESLFEEFNPEKNDRSLRHFLTFCGELPVRPRFFDTFFEQLTAYLKRLPHNKATKRLMADLIGYPSLLTSTPFAKAFLDGNCEFHLVRFITEGWRDTIAEGLNGKYFGGGKLLWRVIGEKYPKDFPGQYPAAPEIVDKVLLNFKTKEELEEAWIKKKAPKILAKLEQLVLSLNLLPIVLWGIISEYLVTLNDI